MRRARNCNNLLRLSDESRAFLKSSEWIDHEILSKDATKVHTLGEVRLYECPLTYITRDTADMIRMAYLAESTSKLFTSGGVGDQPSWFVKAFELCKIEQKRKKEPTDG